MIASPAFVFGLLLATFYGVVAHFLVNGDGRRLVALVMASWVGFALGQGIGQVMAIDALSMGPIHLLSASLGALIATVMTAILSMRRRPPP